MTDRDLDYSTAGLATRGMSEKSNGSVHRLRPRFAVDLIPFLLSIGTVFYLYIGLGDGQLFNEDYAVYLQQAWNIANHVPMANVGVINYFDPSRPLLMNGPLTFPSLLPLIYAYPVFVFGFDLQIFKTIQIGLLLGGLLLFCYAMKRWGFTIVEVSSSILSFTLCYEVRYSINYIGSDLPFILFLMVALFSIDSFVKSTGTRRYGWGILSGAAIFLAVSLRTVGLSLLPTLLLADLLAHRLLNIISLTIPMITLTALWIGQRALGLSGGNYEFITNFRFFTPGENIQQFYWAFAQPSTNSAFPRVAIGIFLILAALATIGVVYEAARGMVIAIFIVAYTALLLVLPNFGAGPRYLVPNLLVLGAFAARGATLISRMAGAGMRTRQAGVWGTAVLGLAWCILMPSPLPSGHWNFGVAADPAREMFAFIREQTPADALLAVSKPRSFHLFTRRTAIRPPVLGTTAEMMAWLKDHRVSYVVVKYSPPQWNYDLTDCPEMPLCRTDHDTRGIEELFRNSDFVLFHLS
jgi:hypothetical protein